MPSPLALLAIAAVLGTVLGLALTAYGAHHQRTHTHGTTDSKEPR